jgi:hypothetical protein
MSLGEFDSRLTLETGESKVVVELDVGGVCKIDGERVIFTDRQQAAFDAAYEAFEPEDR